jgi:hypothetical protein
MNMISHQGLSSQIQTGYQIFVDRFSDSPHLMLGDIHVTCTSTLLTLTRVMIAAVAVGTIGERTINFQEP